MIGIILFVIDRVNYCLNWKLNNWLFFSWTRARGRTRGRGNGSKIYCQNPAWGVGETRVIPWWHRSRWGRRPCWSYFWWLIVLCQWLFVSRFVSSGIHINIQSRENGIPFRRYQGTDTLLMISESFFILVVEIKPAVNEELTQYKDSLDDCTRELKRLNEKLEAGQATSEIAESLTADIQKAILKSRLLLEKIQQILNRTAFWEGLCMIQEVLILSMLFIIMVLLRLWGTIAVALSGWAVTYSERNIPLQLLCVLCTALVSFIPICKLRFFYNVTVLVKDESRSRTETSSCLICRSFHSLVFPEFQVVSGHLAW